MVDLTLFSLLYVKPQRQQYICSNKVLHFDDGSSREQGLEYILSLLGLGECEEAKG